MVKGKSQIKKLSEVEKLRIRMDYKFSKVDDKLSSLGGRFDKTDNKLDIVLTQLDSIAGQFKKFDEEQTMQSGQIATHSDEIKELQSAVFTTA